MRSLHQDLKSPDGPFSLGPWIAKTFGSSALQRIVEEGLLRIGVLPTILDTLWFVDGKRCQFSLANALSGPYRPYIHCGEGADEGRRLLDYCNNLAKTDGLPADQAALASCVLLAAPAPSGLVGVERHDLAHAHRRAAGHSLHGSRGVSRCH